MNTEWVNSSENAPHRFVSDAQTALNLARELRRDGAGGTWDMLHPTTGRAMSPYVKPAPGIWPPVYPDRSNWTIDNVFVGITSLRDLFALDFVERLPGTPVTPLLPVIRTVAVATPVTAIEGDVIGARPLLLAKSAGAIPISTRSLFEIADLLADGYRILRADGTFATITEFMGGVLADGEPLTVWLGRGWLPGQQEALIQAGITPVTDIEKVFSAGPSKLLVGGAIAAAALLFLRRKKK